MPIARSLRRERWYNHHGFFQVLTFPDVRATPALLDFEKAYQEETGACFYDDHEYYGQHVKATAFQGFLACVMRETWDVLLCIGWNAGNPLVEFRAQRQFLLDHGFDPGGATTASAPNR